MRTVDGKLYLTYRDIHRTVALAGRADRWPRATTPT